MDDPTAIPDEAEAGTGLPDPDERARRCCAGVPVEIAGREWLLTRPGTHEALDRPRDCMCDAIHFHHGAVFMADVHDAGLALLVSNYRLTADEAATLLALADPDALAAAVREAIFGPPEPLATFSIWQRASLRANGIDPETVPPAELPAVLRILIATGRTPGVNEFVASAAQMDAFRSIQGGARGR